MEESKQEKLLNAIFGTEPKPKALRFSLNLDDVTVDVAIKKNKKSEVKGCQGGCKCGGRK
jgi:hypothetical protein